MPRSPAQARTIVCDLQKIAMDYINSHGKDKEGGRWAGTTFTAFRHHHRSLTCTNPSGPSAPLEPGMVITRSETASIFREEISACASRETMSLSRSGYKMLHQETISRGAVDEIEKLWPKES